MARTRWPAKVGDRGLRDYGRFTDRYGAKVKVRTSSEIGGRYLWVFHAGGSLHTAREFNDGAIYLDRRQATMLRAALDRWLAR